MQSVDFYEFLLNLLFQHLAPGQPDGKLFVKLAISTPNLFVFFLSRSFTAVQRSDFAIAIRHKFSSFLFLFVFFMILIMTVCL